MVDISTLTACIVIFSIGFGLLGMSLMWRKGKTAEAISLLNTALLVILIILLIFPPRLFT